MVSTRAMETTCSSSIGGVITSGGGFSNIYDRDDQASWQVRGGEEEAGGLELLWYL